MKRLGITGLPNDSMGYSFQPQLLVLLVLYSNDSMVYLIPRINIMISTCSCILCLFFAIMFLVCGDVSTCIFSACRHASHKLRGIVLARMSPSCSINNINRVAKFSETPYFIYTK